jgi:hypothetical protein
MKFSVDLARMTPKAYLGHAELCGAALARAHARTGDPAMMAGYLGDKGGFDEAVAEFAVAYARQNQLDHAELRRAIRAGRVPSAPGA